jgi:chromosome segregation ATPase
METTGDPGPIDTKPAYTTSKQVQAWFLGRSRDLWKNKYAKLKLDHKRLQQRVADVDRSRAQWRNHAQSAQLQMEQLQAENTRIQAELDAAAEALQKKLSRVPSQ